MAPKPSTRPRKNASQERSRATVTALLDATARVLTKHGYDRASTNRVAEAAGVSIGSLYQYFPSKEALVASLLERHVDEIRGILHAELPRLVALPLPEGIEEAVRLMVAAHAHDPKLHKVLVEQTPRTGRLEKIRGVEEEMTEILRTYLEARRAELRVTDLELAAFIVVGTVEALTHTAVLTRPELLGEPFVREVTSVVVRYLRA
jgi:AcrR family transcriptional regulator